MDIATIVYTSPRPKPTLKRTLDSLNAAQLGPVEVFEDNPKTCQLNAYFSALQNLIERKPCADAYLVVEDDVVFCQGVRDYLEKTLWPSSELEIGFCSIYCSSKFKGEHNGWVDMRHYGRKLFSSLAWIFPAQTARRLVDHLAKIDRCQRRHGDKYILRWLRNQKLIPYYHQPSLAQHLAPRKNSACGNHRFHAGLLADNFPGEQFHAMSLLKCNEGGLQVKGE